MEHPIRICMMGSDLSVRGGISSVVDQLLHHPWSPDIKIEYVPTHVSGSLAERCKVFCHSYFRLRKLLRTGQVDLVHLHMSQRGSFHRKYLLHRLARRYGVPDILHLHGSEFMTFYEQASPRVKRRIHRLLQESSRVLVLGSNWAHNIRSIEQNVNLCILRNAVVIPRSCARWDDSRSNLAYLGVLIPRKGVSDLLQALQLLKQDPLPRPVHLTIAGTGEAQQALQAQCRELGLTDTVEFVGWIDSRQKLDLLLQSQCFVLPSYNEGLPVCVLEAISCGVPAVSTNVGSVDEAIKNHENGVLVSPGSPKELAEAIRWVLSDEQRWLSLSRQARETARSQFDSRQSLAGLEKIYRSVARRETP